MKRTNAFCAAVLAATILGILLPLAAGAAPAAHSAKNAAKPQAVTTLYRAQCGMMYTAAEAKKDHYICPMDHKKMTPVHQASFARKTRSRKG